MAENLPTVALDTPPGRLQEWQDNFPSAAEIRERGKQFKDYIAALKEFVDDNLEEGDDKDYGVIPGTKKRSLYQAGADKILGLFGTRAVPTLVCKEENAETGRLDVTYRIDLVRNGQVIGSCIAFGSSFESKWRYRYGARKCPNCNGDTIRRSKFAPRGGGEPGWYCTEKACGGQFAVNDPAITEQQEVGKITNADIVDVFHTVHMVTQKRGKVGATRTAFRLTGLGFTDTVGDKKEAVVEDGGASQVPYTPDAPHTTDRKPTGNGKPVKPDLDPARQSKLTEMEAGMFWAAADKVAKGHAAAIAHVQTAIDTLRDSGKLPPTCWGWQEIANDAQAEAVLKALGKKGDK